MTACPPGQITSPVLGAPFQPGDRVRVVAVVDNMLIAQDLGLDEGADVEAYLVGRTGVVVHLNYDCGCGQRFPDDPMIGVLLDGHTAPASPHDWPEFWAEELATAAAP